MSRSRKEEDKEIDSGMMGLDTLNARVKRRSVYLACTVSLVLALVLLIVVFLGTNNIIRQSISSGFIIQGLLLSVAAGVIVGFTYYVADAWMTL